MSRTLVILTVCLGAYALLDLVVSALVAVLWRTRAMAPVHLPPRTRARRLFLLRLVPSITAAILTLAVIGPAFAVFEPPSHDEKIGPAMALLALAAVAHLSIAVSTALRNLWLTSRFERTWLRDSSRIDVPAGVPAFAVQSPTPLVAVVGVFNPKLIAAQSVLDACTPEEIARIVGHERGHLQSHDNLKSWLLTSLPDTLRWTRVHEEIFAAWHCAAEDAADDATTTGLASERAELAALLLKVVRLAPAPMWDVAVASPFVQDEGLERRVKRLLKAELEPPAPIAKLPLLIAGLLIAGIVATLSSSETLERIFHTFERLVAIGR